MTTDKKTMSYSDNKKTMSYSEQEKFVTELIMFLREIPESDQWKVLEILHAMSQKANV